MVNFFFFSTVFCTSLSFACSLEIVGDPIQSECPAGWTSREDSCYIFLESNETNHNFYWNEAESSCHRLGAFLVSLGSEEEETFVVDFVDKYNGKWTGSFWLGAYRWSDHSGWTWTDGSPFNYSNWELSLPDIETLPLVAFYSERSHKWTILPARAVITFKAVCKMKALEVYGIEQQDISEEESSSDSSATVAISGDEKVALISAALLLRILFINGS